MDGIDEVDVREALNWLDPLWESYSPRSRPA